MIAISGTKATCTSSLTDLLFEERGVGRCLVAPDGTVLRANGEWLRSTIPRAVRDDARPYHVYSPFDDLAERKRVEEALWRNQQRARAASKIMILRIRRIQEACATRGRPQEGHRGYGIRHELRQDSVKIRYG